MNNIKTFFLAFYNLNKRDFWFLIFVTVVMGIVINLYPFHPFVKAGIVIVTAGYIFNFMRSASVLPSVSSDFDRYSWKYFQGLPLSKKELLISLVLTDLLVMLPSLVWFLAFYKQLSAIFTGDIEPVNVVLAVKIVLCLIPLLLSISLSSIKNNIVFPRKQYSKVDPRIAFFNFIKRAAIGFTIALYAGILIYHGSEYITWDPKPLLVWIYKNSPPMSSWYFVPLLSFSVVVQYFRTLKTWQNEKISYVKIDWQPKRDFSIIAVCLVLFWVPVNLMDVGTPDRYRDSALVTATYKQDFKKMSTLLAKGEDINKPNEHGYFPLMVAAKEGHYHTFRWLLSKGAIIQVAKKDPNHKPQIGTTLFLAAVQGGNHEIVEHLLKNGADVNEMDVKNKHYAIHYAANSCKPKVLDLLIEYKAKLNVLNGKKQTALHGAADRNCFPNVALLLDAGINPNQKDKHAKLAKDYLNSKQTNQRDLAFYLEKRTRAPASK